VYRWNDRIVSVLRGTQDSRIKWTEETLDKWLTDTEKLVPNNDMTFHVEKTDERSEIIAYLKRSGK
jgi:cytochrome c